MPKQISQTLSGLLIPFGDRPYESRVLQLQLLSPTIPVPIEVKAGNNRAKSLKTQISGPSYKDRLRAVRELCYNSL